jgi:glycerol-3-phosphate acyltransferase PlsY
MYLALALTFMLGYLLGSIPFGLVFTKLSGGPDIRSIGSGNIGATNVLRTGRKGLAAATLICDALKGTVAVLVLAKVASYEASLLAGFGAFVGHLFPVWLKFRGGKGVATYIGVLFAVSWPVALIFCAIWLIIAAATRYSSLAALAATAFTPLWLWLLDQRDAAAWFLAMAALSWLMHRANIARLLAGTEGKIGKR